MASKMKPLSPFFIVDDKQKSSLTRSPPLTMDDVTYQGRMLMNDFIHDRMLQDGIANAPVVSDLQEPGTPCGPKLDHSREIARALRCIGDELDRDQKLQELIKKVPPEAEHKTFYHVASVIFRDGVFNWGRVVALFYFAYNVCLKALDRVPLIRAVINLIMEIIRDKVAQWIIDRGGWEAIREYFGATWKQVALVGSAAMATVLSIYFFKS